MSCLTDDLFYDNIYIQKGVRKRYYSEFKEDEYVFEYPLNIGDRDGYCIDTRGVDSFFFVISEEGRYRLIEIDKYDNLNRGIKRDYISINELNKGYIKLSEFIKEAEYVGREFRRTVPVITYCNNTSIKDNSYLDRYGFENNKHIVLYMKDNTCLVKYMCSYGSGYCIIDCRYIQDSNYEFIGSIYEEYRDRLKVYFDVLKEINKMKYNDFKKKIRTK